MTETTLSVAAVEELAFTALVSAGSSTAAARSVARAVAMAEAEGIASHGLAYVPTYCEHLRCGKVGGVVTASVVQLKPALLVVDAGTGFAHPAIEAGFEKLVPMARENGIAAMAVRNSYNCGVLGYHTEQLARTGLLGLGFTNAPASIAPVGGLKPVVGTNPFAIAAPDGRGGVALSIDQSASVVAKSEVMKRKREGRTLPRGWCLGPDGAPTTDPEIALKGTMVPAGGYKGVGVALLVEILAAAASGATLGLEASPFSGPLGGPPRTGQFFMAIDVQASSAGAFSDRLTRLVAAIATQEDAHVPGGKRAAAKQRALLSGINVPADLIVRITALS